MIIEIKIPSPGESISEVVIASWMVENGAIVEKNQEIAEIESDKATLPLIAQEGGKIEIIANAGDTVAVGSVACKIDSSFAGESTKSAEVQKTIPVQEKASEPIKKEEPKTAEKVVSEQYQQVKVSPVAKNMLDEHQISVEEIMAGLQRLGKKEVELYLENKSLVNKPTENRGEKTEANSFMPEAQREKNTEKMSSLRKKLSERLVAVKNETAMLTTFNEVDMSAVMDLRQKYQKNFVDKYGVKVGFMSFFLKATAMALKAYPTINAMIDGDEIVYYQYADIGIAVQSAKGLLVPVIRNVESLSLAEIELKIKEYGEKGKSNKISLEEMANGTFTITNGGTFGSLMSTPIINPPQSGILGMHNIVDRPVAVNGQVVIRPMMYIALSYDHRIIDGKSAVSFLVMLKDLIENPYKMLLGGKDENRVLLGL